MSAVQCGKITNFCEKHKYRKEISLDQKFKIKGKGKNYKKFGDGFEMGKNI